MFALILHGGAWDIPDDMLEAHRSGCTTALKIGWNILQNGGTAIDTVEQVIRYMENDETFGAGRGSHLNALGQIELDASIMDGKAIRCGAVAAVQRISNPITLARKVMEESEHILLVGDGAERFANEHGVAWCHPEELITERERKRWKEVQERDGFTTKDSFRTVREYSDTVGAVALDKDGNICVGTSTGGTLNKYPGRVGDSPLIGCGSYADNAVGGVSTTGWGEAMIKVVMAKTVINLMEMNGGQSQTAAENGIEILKRKAHGLGGVIVLNKQGHFGIAFNTPRMARAYVNSEMKEPFVAV
ncbi:MAG: isoaspartyl peptidase/L-asparaginase [Ignavibacteriae bacterium]|nr:isoaspartyl peptidase/L-asparaginase [Ignavibacteriota bacterium]